MGTIYLLAINPFNEYLYRNEQSDKWVAHFLIFGSTAMLLPLVLFVSSITSNEES